MTKKSENKSKSKSSKQKNPSSNRTIKKNVPEKGKRTPPGQKKS